MTELASVSLKRKAELSKSIESTDKTPDRWLAQVGGNEPSDIVSEGSTKKKERFELTETSTQSSSDVEPVPAEYVNKYMGNIVSNQTLINEIMSFYPVPENLKNPKLIFKRTSAEQDKYICKPGENFE